eukprot:6377449-Karenia_brevis.AAC.1
MGWEATDDITKEEMSQMAQELSFEVTEAHEPTPKAPLGKNMAAQGIASDWTTWLMLQKKSRRRWRRIFGYQ